MSGEGEEAPAAAPGFACVEDCSECCIARDYYPSVKFGKVGVLLLPGEAGRLRRLAAAAGLEISIVPRIAVSRPGQGPPSPPSSSGAAPGETIAYQMMGVDADGDTCPFLDTAARSPHGGYACSIYGDRPLACRAYPVVSDDPARLDRKCRFCEACPRAARDAGGLAGLDGELEALALIRAGVEGRGAPSGRTVWRYATGVGRREDMGRIRRGWFRDRGAGPGRDRGAKGGRGRDRGAKGGRGRGAPTPCR